MYKEFPGYSYSIDLALEGDFYLSCEPNFIRFIYRGQIRRVPIGLNHFHLALHPQGFLLFDDYHYQSICLTGQCNPVMKVIHPCRNNFRHKFLLSHYCCKNQEYVQIVKLCKIGFNNIKGQLHSFESIDIKTSPLGQPRIVEDKLIITCKEGCHYINVENWEVQFQPNRRTVPNGPIGPIGTSATMPILPSQQRSLSTILSDNRNSYSRELYNQSSHNRESYNQTSHSRESYNQSSHNRELNQPTYSRELSLIVQIDLPAPTVIIPFSGPSLVSHFCNDVEIS